MTRVFIIHRWEGSSQGDWLPWIKSKLKNLGYEVVIPDMPETNMPVIEKWVGHLDKICQNPDTNTFFIGHSIGCQTILRYLEKLNKPVGGAIFVAGWFILEDLEDDETKKIAMPWLTTPIDLKKIKQILPKSALFISDNDPYGAFEQNKNKFKKLGSDIIVLHNAGHITKDDGFTEIPAVLEQFQKMNLDPEIKN